MPIVGLTIHPKTHITLGCIVIAGLIMRAFDVCMDVICMNTHVIECMWERINIIAT